jgi:ABC-type cobalamin/Fe3+-siderophores transport system ATPase subunit
MVVSVPCLSVEDLSYGYPGHAVGHHVDFTVAAGEVLCVLGRNGEGKSTLFKTILGLLPPLAGAVRVEWRAHFELEFTPTGIDLRVCAAERRQRLPV